MSSLPDQLQEQLKAHDQLHVLKFWGELDEEEQQAFVLQLSSIDFIQLDKRISKFQSEGTSESRKIEPCEVVLRDQETSLRAEGESIIRRGELGVLTVAGGQGTRLGWSGPKGTYPATPLTGKSLFQLIAEQIVCAQQKYKVTIPWYLMTSVENDDTTRAFLLDNNCFGLNRTDIFVFTQSQVPAIDQQGKMLLTSKHEIAMNPDGHGGVISALQASGGLAEMEGRGVKYLSYVQVDNPLVMVVDPVFLGLHASEGSSKEASSKCVSKLDPDERVGVFCMVNSSLSIVEYSDLSTQDAQRRNEDNSLVFGAGSIAMHIFSTEFLNRVADDLPWHAAHKRVAFLDDEGNLVSPEEPNAVKFEKFVFEVLQFASNSIVVETLREEEFAPIKNTKGNDSPATSHAMQLARSVKWLRELGIEVSENAQIELSPLLGACPEDINASLLPKEIKSEEVLAL